MFNLNDYKIIELLCSSQPDNIELAQQLCDSQGWDILAIIAKHGYREIGLFYPNWFLQATITCNGQNLATLPNLLPAGLQCLHCANNQLTYLPVLPAGLKFINCSNNQLAYLPKLPAGLKALYCDNNPFTPETLARIQAFHAFRA